MIYKSIKFHCFSFFPFRLNNFATSSVWVNEKHVRRQPRIHLLLKLPNREPMNISIQFTSRQLKYFNSRNLFTSHLLFNQMTGNFFILLSIVALLFSSSTSSVNVNSVTINTLTLPSHQSPLESAFCVKIFHCNFTQSSNETIEHVNWYLNSNIFYSFSLVNQSTWTLAAATGINIDVSKNKIIPSTQFTWIINCNQQLNECQTVES